MIELLSLVSRTDGDGRTIKSIDAFCLEILRPDHQLMLVSDLRELQECYSLQIILSIAARCH